MANNNAHPSVPLEADYPSSQISLKFPPVEEPFLSRTRLYFVLFGIAIMVAGSVVLVIRYENYTPEEPTDAPTVLPEDPLERAKTLMSAYPLIDGHNDLPWYFRKAVKDQASKIDLNQRQQNTQTDIPRIREGLLGGQFWSVYVPCSSMWKDAVRETIEQVELVLRWMDQYPDTFSLALSSEDIRNKFNDGKVASLMGMEGGHSIDASLQTLRMFYRLGVRYMTLTHSCTNEFAQSCGNEPPLPPTAVPNGLTSFGIDVVLEMNRLGMFVDISHVSALAMHAVLNVTKAPVMFSHSSAYGLCPTPRNVPDDVLARLPANGGVVMVNFYNAFINCTNSSAATLGQVADHIDYIIRHSSEDNVGIGSDYDGVGGQLPIGLEDVSKYPDLFAELIRRGYSDERIIKILGGNLLRAFAQVEAVATEFQQTQGPFETICDFDFAGNNDTCRQPWPSSDDEKKKRATPKNARLNRRASSN